MSIVKSAVNGVSWVALSTLIKGGLQLLQLIILARYLTPLELGITAALNLVIGFSQVFGDAGLSNAVIYHKSLNRSQLAQLYSINIAFGALVSLLIAVSTPAIAAFFAIPSLPLFLLALAPVFVIRSLSQQILAKLQQQMRFNLIAKIEVVSQAVAFTVVVSSLMLEQGVWSVVYGQLTLAVLLSLSYMIIAREHLQLPRWVNWQQVSQPVKYGLYQSGESLINYGSAQFDQLIVGKFLGPEKLGIYAYIKDLVFKPALQLINPVVNKVAFPLMVNYKESHSLSNMYTSILQILSFINIPLYGCVALFPELVLSLAYGTDWQQHGEILRWLALYMLIISLMNPVGVLMRTAGAVRRAFWWNLGVAVIRPGVIFIAIAAGLKALTVALCFLQLAFFVLHWRLLLKPVIALPLLGLIQSISLPLVTTICLASGIVLIQYYVGHQFDIALVIGGCIGYLLFTAKPIITQLKNLRS